MYNADDILIIGDSFCSYRDTKDSWPQIVLSSLTGLKFDSSIEPRGAGFPGGAWWSYRKVLLRELEIKTPKVLIVCHTEPFRIPNDYDYSLNYRSVETKILHVGTSNKSMPNHVAKAAEMYYQELISTDFHLWATNKWFIELDELCAKHNIEKVLHLYCFGGEYTDYTFKHGVTIGIPLFSYAEDPGSYFWRFKRKKINHFSVQGNDLFGKKVTELINNYPGNGVRLEIKMVNYEPS